MDGLTNVGKEEDMGLFHRMEAEVNEIPPEKVEAAEARRAASRKKARNVCLICNERFASKNKLFEHLRGSACKEKVVEADPEGGMELQVTAGGKKKRGSRARKKSAAVANDLR